MLGSILLVVLFFVEEVWSNSHVAHSNQKRFYNRETTPFIRISQVAESFSTLSWLAEILELRKGQLFELHRRKGGYKEYLVHFIIQHFSIVSLLYNLFSPMINYSTNFIDKSYFSKQDWRSIIILRIVINSLTVLIQ